MRNARDYPEGGGEIDIKIKSKFPIGEIDKGAKGVSDAISGLVEADPLTPGKPAAPRISMTEQGKLQLIKGVSHASRQLEEAHVSERQARTAKGHLSSLLCPISITTEYPESRGAGSGITLWAIYSLRQETDFTNPIVIGADALGEKGKRAEYGDKGN